MPPHSSFSRRTLLAATSAVAFGAIFRSPELHAQSGDGKRPIGTIGAGRIGSAIGGLWIKNGHKVLFSSRHPEELKDLAAGLGPLAQAGTVDQAIAFGDVVLLTIPYPALPQIGRDHATALKGKIVLDTCNSLVGRDGAIADEVEANGVGVTSQKYLPGTRLVRAFNTMSYKIFASEANRPDPKLAVPIAGDDQEAVRVAAALVRDAGFEPVVVGKLADAKLFQRGGPGYGQQVSAAELKQKLSLPQ